MIPNATCRECGINYFKRNGRQWCDDCRSTGINITDWRECPWRKYSLEIKERDNYTCQYCGKNDDPRYLTMDHIQPKSKGGAHTPDNLVTACWDCNNRKGAWHNDVLIKLMKEKVGA